SDPNYVDPPLLAQHVKPDEQIVRFLVGDGGLDSRLATAGRLLQPRIGIADLPVAEEIKGELARFAQSIAATASGCLWLHGPEGVGKRGAAEAIAQAAKSVLLALDARLVGPTGLEPTLRLALRDAALRGAILYVAGAETWACERHAAARLAAIVRARACPTIFG